jgi:hypothetical protein
MTKEETKERIKVMQAFVDGKPVQYSDGRVWCDSADPAWNPCKKYRIKPGSKYRPFANAEECWTEMKKHQPFGCVKFKDTESGYYMIKAIAIGVVVGIDDTPFSYERTFNEYSFADGTPFGVKVEE